MKAIALILTIGIFIASCSKQQEDSVLDGGVVIKLPPLWKTAISDDGELAQISVDAVVQLASNGVLVGGQKNKQRSLIAIDGADGKIKWEWNDLLHLLNNPSIADPIRIGDDGYYIKDDALFIPFSTSNYCINQKTGATIWKNKIELNRIGICYGLGDLAFYAGSPYYGSNKDDGVYFRTMDASSPDKLLVTPVYEHLATTSAEWTGNIRGCCPFRVASGDTLLAILYLDPYDPLVSSSNSVMSLYNFSKRQWVYERKVIIPKRRSGDYGQVDNSNINFPILYQGNVYFATGRGLACYDPLTGEPIWSASYSQGFGSSGFIIVDNKLIANCGDTYTYCLDPATGRQLWQEKSSGTSTPISYLNGVAYFAGGGDGKLHAIDVTTGKHLWRVKSPDESVNSGAWFYGVCVAVPGKDGQKGRVVATTGLNAYGYEAIR